MTTDILTASARPLFGGAIQFDVPVSYGDASDIRQVPDTQEVFLSQDSDTSIVVEILEQVEEGEAKTDLRAAARFHFDALAHDNAALSSTIETIVPDAPLSPERLTSSSSETTNLSTPRPVLLRGYQAIQKFNSRNPPPPDSVLILLAVWRVDWRSQDGRTVRRSDVVCSANINTGKDGPAEVARVSQWWETAVHNLRIVDYALFEEVKL